MNYLKHQEGGLEAVCEVMERYEKRAAEKAAQEANMQANVKAIKKMIREYSATKESILDDYTEEEYAIAIKEIAEK